MEATCEMPSKTLEVDDDRPLAAVPHRMQNSLGHPFIVAQCSRHVSTVSSELDTLSLPQCLYSSGQPLKSFPSNPCGIIKVVALLCCCIAKYLTSWKQGETVRLVFGAVFGGEWRSFLNALLVVSLVANRK